MPRVHFIVITFSMLTFLYQPVCRSSEYSVNQISTCVSVGEIAMNLTRLRESGRDRRSAEDSAREHLQGDLTLWITSIAELVFSEPLKSTEKVTKQAIGFCLKTMEYHNQLQKGIYL